MDARLPLCLRRGLRFRPRATPTVCGDRVYTLGAMGDLLCLDAATGQVVWQKNLVRDYGVEVPLYGFASPPLVDAERLIAVVGARIKRWWPWIVIPARNYGRPAAPPSPAIARR